MLAAISESVGGKSDAGRNQEAVVGVGGESRMAGILRGSTGGLPLITAGRPSRAPVRSLPAHTIEEASTGFDKIRKCSRIP